MCLGISVIIPTFNESSYISECLRSVLESLETAEIPYEILVVDNCSTDDTSAIASSFPVKVYSCEKRGPAACRNKGVRMSQFDILAFVDGDCLVNKNWFERIVERFNDEDVGAYGGPVLSPYDGGWVERCWSPVSVKEYRRLNASLAGANFAIKRSVFIECGGFDEELITAEDDDLSKRVCILGYRCINESCQSVIHLGYPKSLYSIFLKQIWHSSSQLKAHGFLGDKVIFITFIWILFVALFLLFLGIGEYGLMLSAFACILSVPAIVSFRRNRNSNRLRLRDHFLSFIIAIFFISGRAVGLVKELIELGAKKIFHANGKK